ncbi:hypothetical protein Ahia01_000380300 [Argonauta hians]
MSSHIKNGKKRYDIEQHCGNHRLKEHNAQDNHRYHKWEVCQSSHPETKTREQPNSKRVPRRDGARSKGTPNENGQNENRKRHAVGHDKDGGVKMRAEESDASTNFGTDSEDNQRTSKRESTEPASADSQLASSVKMDAEIIMLNEASTKDTSSTSVAISIGCQADEDSEYECASYTEELEEGRYLQPRLQGKTIQYLVDCDICKKSFHDHRTELTLEDMQGNL